MVEYEMQVDEGTDEQILEQVVGHVEVGPQVAHVVESLDDVVLDELDHLEAQDYDQVNKAVLIIMMEKTTQQLQPALRAVDVQSVEGEPYWLMKQPMLTSELRLRSVRLKEVQKALGLLAVIQQLTVEMVTFIRWQLGELVRTVSTLARKLRQKRKMQSRMTSVVLTQRRQLEQGDSSRDYSITLRCFIGSYSCAQHSLQHSSFSSQPPYYKLASVFSYYRLSYCGSFSISSSSISFSSSALPSFLFLSFCCSNLFLLSFTCLATSSLTSILFSRSLSIPPSFRNSSRVVLSRGLQLGEVGMCTFFAGKMGYQVYMSLYMSTPREQVSQVLALVLGLRLNSGWQKSGTSAFSLSWKMRSGLMGTGSPILGMPFQMQIFLMCSMLRLFMDDSWMSLSGQKSEQKKNSICSSFSEMELAFSLFTQLNSEPSLLYSDIKQVLPPSLQHSSTFVNVFLVLLSASTSSSTCPAGYALILTKPCSLCTPKNSDYSQYQKSTLNSLSAIHPLPFFLSCFSFFFMLLLSAISEAFRLLTLMRSSSTLLLGNGSIFCSGTSSLPAIRLRIRGNGFYVSQGMLLFQDSFRPLSVNQMSYSLPNQLKPARSRSTWMLKRILDRKTASKSSSFRHLPIAALRLEQVTCSVAMKRASGTQKSSTILMACSILESLSFFRYLGISGAGESRSLRVTSVLSYLCCAWKTLQLFFSVTGEDRLQEQRVESQECSLSRLSITNNYNSLHRAGHSKGHTSGWMWESADISSRLAAVACLRDEEWAEY